tara:strand:- start:531 stop:2534 length:2004 start_codon:yes stop_codon:yes gene_type:complete
MARSAPAFSSFTAGEISPRLEGRTNIEKYREGLSDLTNMVVMPHGGVTRRPGTEYLGEIKTSSVKTRLIPFQFKTSDTYILEFGNQVMRVYRNDLQVLASSAKTITAITKANPGVLTSNSHGFSNGDEIFVDNVGGMTEVNGRNYRVANSSTNTFTLTDLFGVAINTTNFTTYTSGGTATEIFEVATPYPEADLFDLRFAQSADTMFIVHPSHDIRTLTRSDHNNWTFATFSITGSPNPSLSGANNRPSVVSFFEQRLVFGNTNNNPQTLFFSKNGDYDNFTVGTGDNDALIYTIASNQVNAIRFLSATRVLTVGTSGGEYVLTSTNDGPVTPTTTLIRKYSNYGTAQIEPVQVADVTLFAQRGKRKIREFKFVGDVNTGGYSAPDMTILAEHVTEGGLVQMAFQQEPDSVVWCIRADGTLLGLTYRREEEVVAWHKHVIGGSFGSGQAVVESIATLPTDTGEDELYMIVKRTINSVTKRYVEKLKVFDFGNSTTGAFFVDSGLSYSGGAANSLSALYHLEGETLQVLGNGASHPNKTVSNGAISLDFASTTAAVGYGYDSSMQTLRIESGSVDGTSQGKPKRVHGITIRFFETVGAEVGNDSGEVDRIFFRDSSMDMDTAVPMFTGDKEIEFPGGFDDDDRVFIKQGQPLPMTVLAFYPRMNTFDK